MPMYYSNPYASAYPIAYGNYYNQLPTMQQMPQIQQQQPQYMINVDGENSAKSWQPTVIPQPNTIIPLFDSDGQHVYFKTYDAYGRMNPIRKGRIVFDDEIQISETAQAPAAPDMSEYVTKKDFDSIKQELEHIRETLTESSKQNNQNSNNNRGDRR